MMAGAVLPVCLKIFQKVKGQELVGFEPLREAFWERLRVEI